MQWPFLLTTQSRRLRTRAFLSGLRWTNDAVAARRPVVVRLAVVAPVANCALVDGVRVCR
jgi:hypothetical protein